MRNHSEKARDMSRSVLPSTARKSARENKRNGHKRARQANRAIMHGINRGVHADDVDAAHDNYTEDLRTGDWECMVDDRRGADKVAPLRRWVAHMVEHDPKFKAADPAGREALLLNLIGNTTIGRHALSHVDDIIGRQNPHEYGAYHYGAARRNVGSFRTHEDNLRVVLDALAEGDLNKTIKRATHRDLGFRYYDDVSAWVYRADAGGAEAFLAAPPRTRQTVTEITRARVDGVYVERPYERRKMPERDAWMIAMNVLDEFAEVLSGTGDPSSHSYQKLFGLLSPA